MKALPLIAALLVAAPATGQGVPRTPDGHPDLTGVWSNASLTRLTRSPAQPKLAVSRGEAQAIARRDPMTRQVESDAPEAAATAPLAPVGMVGQGYNAFWIDPGSALGRVNGEYRTSWLVDPPSGQLPLSEAGRDRIRAWQAARDGPPSGPESLEIWDRCLIGSRGSGGPGMLNNIYNSNYQLVLTPASVVIVVEMIHDARTIPILPTKAAAQAAHGAVPRWFGDSVAWWEGDDLVIETTNVMDLQGRSGPIFLTPQGRVTERLRRVAAGEVFYAFEVEDPAYYTRPWRAEMTLTALKGQVYEFACHEGNYAMTGILGAARQSTAGATP